MREADLYGIHRVGEIPLDRGMITALVERWRPETHTFHLSEGEATITLRDVAILIDLPVSGRAVTSPSPRHTKERIHRMFSLRLIWCQFRRIENSKCKLVIELCYTNFYF